ncbi:MAG TPA: glycerate kinase [Opitutaceae bacterium]|nr:glycerate kinase [Opitutaceae bacterium]
MRVLLAFDKFKDALSARQACDIAAAALRTRHPNWTLDPCPLTDGGEGFLETLTEALDGRYDHRSVVGPRDRNVSASIGLVGADRLPAPVREILPVPSGTVLAIVGLASGSGIELLAPDRRDPWHTTTFGTGELLHLAAGRKVGAILLGLGGSATNDLGLGALAALGLRCLRAGGRAVVIPTPATWPEIARLAGRVELPPVFIACDVANPLLGPHGATATFGPQKGLRAEDFSRLEGEMARMAGMLCGHFRRPESLAAAPGTGAAGGIGFGLMVAAGAKLVSGFELVSRWLDLPARLAAADLVVTGEGRYDVTSLGGKGPGAIAAEARRQGKKVRIFAGSLGVPADAEHQAITPAGVPLPDALRRAPELLAAAVARLL